MPDGSRIEVRTKENNETPHGPLGPAGLRRRHRVHHRQKRRAPEDSAREQEWATTRLEVEKRREMVTTSSETAGDAKIVEVNKISRNASITQQHQTIWAEDLVK